MRFVELGLICFVFVFVVFSMLGGSQAMPSQSMKENSKIFTEKFVEMYPEVQEKPVASVMDTLDSNHEIATDGEDRLLARSIGVHFGTVGEVSGLDGVDLSFGIYQRHKLLQPLFGEGRVSLGFFNGIDERVRLVPVEYRLNYHLSVNNSAESGERSFFTPYLFAGMGLLYHKPLEVRRPDDPYTVELGETLPPSDFWDFKSAITPFFPAGVGLELQLDPRTRFDLQVGYHQPVGSLGAWGEGEQFQTGYVGVNIGLRFSSVERERAPSFVPPAPPLDEIVFRSPPVLAVSVPKRPSVPLPKLLLPSFVEADNLAEVMRERLMESVGSFTIMSSQIGEEILDQLEFKARLLNYLDSGVFEVRGHSDSVGNDRIKQMISESRARSAWLALVEWGVDPGRLSYRGYSDLIPRADNGTPEGRAKNRRVDLTPLEKMPLRLPVKTETVKPLEYTLGEPVFPADEIVFSWLDFRHEIKMQERLTRLLALLENEMQLRLKIGSLAFYEGSGEAFLDEIEKAREDKIRAWFIERGINPERVYTFDPQSDEIWERYEMNPANLPVQLTFLIPEVKQSAELHEDSQGYGKRVEQNPGFVIQIGAFSSQENARRFRKEYSHLLKKELEIIHDPETGLYMVRLAGGYEWEEVAAFHREICQTHGLSDAFILQASHSNEDTQQNSDH